MSLPIASPILAPPTHRETTPAREGKKRWSKSKAEPNALVQNFQKTRLSDLRFRYVGKSALNYVHVT